MTRVSPPAGRLDTSLGEVCQCANNCQCWTDCKPLAALCFSRLSTFLRKKNACAEALIMRTCSKAKSCRERFSTALHETAIIGLPFNVLCKKEWTLLLQLRVSSRHGGFEDALFLAINFYSVREKVKKILRKRQTRHWLLSRRYGKAQPVNAKKWREKAHVVTHAIHVSRKRGGKSF